MVAPGIIAIGKQSYPTVGGASPLFEVALVFVRFNHVASYFQTAGQFLKRRESKKVCHFRNLVSRFP
jgi:hypothetical protein